jgi:hypothetical protein
MRNILVISQEAFTNMISGLVAAGVTWTARELENGRIEIIFTGGY